jgi:putative transposase
MGVNMDGERDVLGCWVGPTGGEGAKFRMTVLTELRNWGIHDTSIVCCDGLKGLPESIRATWPLADVQLCVVHLVRSSSRYTSKKDWGQVCREMRQSYTAPTVDAVLRHAGMSRRGARPPRMDSLTHRGPRRPLAVERGA